jgi:hypothetical protein
MTARRCVMEKKAERALNCPMVDKSASLARNPQGGTGNSSSLALKNQTDAATGSHANIQGVGVRLLP